jgi:DNA-binding protein YbaB
MDMNNFDFKTMMTTLMQGAQQVQEKMRQSDKIVTGKAGGDLVVAQVNMQMQVTSLVLAPMLLEEKLEVISELIMGAVNQAMQGAQQMIKEDMMAATQKMSEGRFGF